jgi:hypothetical protein
MVGKVMNLSEYITPDTLGCAIARRYIQDEMLRAPKVAQWMEVQKFVFATDTKQTTNSKLPWKNSTTIPKTCQIRDNLHANYMAALFPRRKWLEWLADMEESNSLEKRKAIIWYMSWVINQDVFKKEVSKLIYDYIDYGNAFAGVDWVDLTQNLPDRQQVGYVGPVIRRYSPLDIVFNPTAPDFIRAPKIIRSIISLGEVKDLLEREGGVENKAEYEELWNYMKDLRRQAAGVSDFKVQDEIFNIAGFHSYRAYLESDYVEILTFMGDMYDRESDVFYKNHVITVVDRHKVISKKPNPSYFGYPPIFHAGWRIRQDNLWAMGPLENLIGMQYRIDHLENMKADCFDLIAFPPLLIKGSVNDFEWGPFARIHVDEEGTVEVLSPDVQVLQANQEIFAYQQQMEEMAGSPKEAMGFRTPGEKTKYEVQRLENAASRIFQSKIAQFEEQILEPLLNAMLEMARRNITKAINVPVISEDFNVQTFETLSAADITGAGRIKPMAARHFAEKAELIQNLTNFANSPLGQDPNIIVHFSGLQTAKMLENWLDIEDYKIVRPYIRLSEEADAKRQAMVLEEETQMQMQTPAGIAPDDSDAGLMLPPGSEAPMMEAPVAA